MSAGTDADRVLARGAGALGVELDAGRRALLLDYLALLARWNRAYNLTAVRDPAEMVVRHLLDCLAVAPLVRGPALLDVGSGAGLPGLVLAVALPGLHATLLDPSLKRTRFLTHAVHSLAIGTVSVRRGRLEDVIAPPRYDTVVSRATLKLDALVAAAPALLAPAGRLVAMLGKAPEAVPAIPPGFHLDTVPLRVPGAAGPRHAALMTAPAGP